MDRETLLLVAIAMLALAAFSVGVSGWILLARDRTLRRSLTSASHPEAPEER
jgi:hypothetical protein